MGGEERAEVSIEGEGDGEEKEEEAEGSVTPGTVLGPQAERGPESQLAG